MIQNCKRNIFLYDKNDELKTYVELSSSFKLTAFYNLHENVFTKLNVHAYKEKNKEYRDTVKAIVTFKEPCRLFHMFFDQDDSYCRVIKKDTNRIELPEKFSEIYSYNENFIENFTVTNSLVQDWLKKL